jgi:hypothetical protein
MGNERDIDELCRLERLCLQQAKEASTPEARRHYSSRRQIIALRQSGPNAQLRQVDKRSLERVRS